MPTRLPALLSLLWCLSALPAQELRNAAVAVQPVGPNGAYTGFAVNSADGRPFGTVRFGSLDNLTAKQAKLVGGKLVFSGLTAVPTPKLGPGSRVSVSLVGDEPWPELSFRFELAAFDQDEWQAAFGTVPFHFLALSLPGAEIFHSRGWSIMTPRLDPYSLQGPATGYGRQIVSEWSPDWTYAPAVGAWPLPAMGLWKPADKLYLGFDFDEARLTDHSERELGGSYVWQQAGQGPLAGRKLGEFVTLSWPYANPYRTGLRYPELPAQGVIESHCRLVCTSNLAADDDPTEMIHQYVWQHFADRLPSVPTVADLGWFTDTIRPATPTTPGFNGGILGRVTEGDAARWLEVGALLFHGVGHDGDPVGQLFARGNAAELERLNQQLKEVLTHARKLTIGGEDVVCWQQPLEGEGKLELFGQGVPTIRHRQNWSLGQTLLDVYRQDREQYAELLPYVDGVLRFTKVMLTTRNGIYDVPAAQFCMSGATVSAFCLRYHFTFRDAADPERRALAAEAYKLARTMLYRNLPLWVADNDPDDALDSAFFCEPNSGISWLGAACANEIWWVAYALAQTYVHTGDPQLGHYLYGLVDRWHELYRDEYYPTVRDYDNAFAERYGLFDGAAEKRGARANFGGLWGWFENLAWPSDGAAVRFLCGEKGVLTFNANGRLLDFDEYRYGGDGTFAIRLKTRPGAPEAFDAMLTMPCFDLQKLPGTLTRGGRTAAVEVKHYPERPDTVLVRGVRHGDVIALGGDSAGWPVIPVRIAKPKTDARDSRVAWPAGFQAVDLQPKLNAAPSLDWADNSSLAGYEPGRKVFYGVPFELLDPSFTGGKLGVQSGTVPVKAKGSYLFCLVTRPAADAKLTVQVAGKPVSADLTAAFEVTRGWPPCYEWELDWVAVPLAGKTVDSLSVSGLTLLAATVAQQPATQLQPVLATTAQAQADARAAAEAVAGLQALEPLFAQRAGRICVLPGTKNSRPRAGRTAQLLHRAGLVKYVEFLEPRQLVDPASFNAQRFWVALYLGGEAYPQTVRTAGDGDAALQRFLHSGGTLLALSYQPYPFYYDQDDKPIQNAKSFGLPLSNAWEKPPASHTYTVRRNPQSEILAGLPKQFPFPTAGDLRLRYIDREALGGCDYTPLLTVVDEQGQTVGDAAAWLEYHHGPLAGGRIGYLWCTIGSDPATQTPSLAGFLKAALTTARPGLAETTATRLRSPVNVDGKLDDAAWQQTPALPLTFVQQRPGEPQRGTVAKLCYDQANLYVSFQAEDPDVWSELTARDADLWTEEVVEIFIDPTGEGKHYKEFELNPRGALVDLDIADPKLLSLETVDDYRAWNADGATWAVQVDGTLDNRTDIDRGWTAELAIPFAALGVKPPALGEVWRVQLFRIERPRAGGDEYSTWSATDTFHRPSRFGRLTFGGNPYDEDFSLYPDGSAGQPTWAVEAGQWTIADGVLHGEDSGTGGFVAAGLRLAQVNLQDFTLSLRYRVTEVGGDHRDGFWLGFRSAESGQGYTLAFGQRAVSLHKTTGGRSTGDANPLAQAPWQPDSAWHTLELTARGAEFAVRVDGRQALQATDTPALGLPVLGPGSIVLSARKWEHATGHTKVEIDEVRITP